MATQSFESFIKVDRNGDVWKTVAEIDLSDGSATVSISLVKRHAGPNVMGFMPKFYLKTSPEFDRARDLLSEKLSAMSPAIASAMTGLMLDIEGGDIGDMKHGLNAIVDGYAIVSAVGTPCERNVLHALSFIVPNNWFKTSGISSPL